MRFRQIITVIFLTIGSGIVTTALADTVDDLLTIYSNQDAGPFSSEAGQSSFLSQGITKDGKVRSCTSCHGEQLNKKGKHIVTDKVIQPMAPSVNPERLTDQKKIEKWFRRNCKWTFGRECTAQEKGDFLSFLKNQ